MTEFKEIEKLSFEFPGWHDDFNKKTQKINEIIDALNSLIRVQIDRKDKNEQFK
jgi:hypothetical protein